MRLSAKVQELLCGTRGHELILESGRYQCMHCPKHTKALNMYTVPLSAGERQDLYEFLLEQEYTLIGGG